MKIYKASYAVNKILSSFKVIMIIIIFISVSMNLLGCGQDKPDQILKTDEPLEPDETLKPDELSSGTKPSFSPDNPIDRAFARIAEESGENLTDNVVFTYLYASEWYHEYLFFQNELEGKAENSYDSLDWREIPEFTGKENKANPVLAAAFFNEQAEIYKQKALDSYYSYAESGLGQDMPTDEDELYQYLQGMTMEETPFDYEMADYEDILRSFADQRTKYPLPVLGELPDDGISLAFAPPFGMVLQIKEEKYLCSWSPGYISVRWTMPKLIRGDYDRDGSSELAIIHEVITGSGISVNELYLIEYQEEEVRGYEVTFKTIENLLNNRLTTYYDKDAGTVTLRLDDQSVTGIMPVEDGKMMAFGELNFSEIIYFEAADDRLTLHSQIKMETEPRVFSIPWVDFYADMEYVEAEQGSQIQLTNCRLAFDSHPQTSAQNGDSNQAEDSGDEQGEAAADAQAETSPAELSYFFTDTPMAIEPLRAYANDTSDEAMTAYTELLKGERGFYAAANCQYVNDGSNTLRDVFQNFATALFEPSESEICDYSINYAIIDCGQDGNLELAVNLKINVSIDLYDYTYILQYDDVAKTIKTIHFYDSWDRSKYNLYFYGYLTYHASGGAASSFCKSELIDDNGQLTRIYSYDTGPVLDQATGQILLDTAISIFGRDSDTVAAFSYYNDPDINYEAYTYDEWSSPRLSEYYIGDTKYLRFEYDYTESNEKYDPDFAAKTEKYNGLLAEQGINIMPPAPKGADRSIDHPNHPMITTKLSEYADYITAEPLEWHLLAYTTRKQ